jgi:hypothetical protein
VRPDPVGAFCFLGLISPRPHVFPTRFAQTRQRLLLPGISHHIVMLKQAGHPGTPWFAGPPACSEREPRRTKETAVPAYANTFPPISISPGDSSQVWVTADGNLVSGTKTRRVALTTGGVRPQGRLAMRVSFSVAPGVISLQLQTSDTDVDTDASQNSPPPRATSPTNAPRPSRSPASATMLCASLAAAAPGAASAAPPSGFSSVLPPEPSPPRPPIDTVFTISAQFLRYNPRTESL